MYTRCLFCSGPLGRNRALEELPIGRRLAFDERRGRLWVICGACGRWNLTPIEERWEIIAACERSFRDTRVRIATDNIGLAHLPEGLELVRIGKPLPNEFAAWRYGRRFLARYRRRPIGVAGKAALLGAAPAAALLAGPLGALGVAAIAASAAGLLWRRAAMVVPQEGERPLRINLYQLRRAALVRAETVGEGWALECDVLPAPRGAITSVRHVPAPEHRVTLHGANARAAAALLLPRLNAIGGDSATVEEAAQWVQAAGGPERAFRTMAHSTHVRPPLRIHDESLAALHEPVRLALEMALHEDEERRHLVGELSVLQWMWRREEALASIADGLGRPLWLEEHLARLRATS